MTASRPALRFGVIIGPPWSSSIDEILEAARIADRSGLDIWIAGRAVSNSRGDKAAFEPIALAAAVATATSRCRIGFMALAAGWLPPVYLAKALITLDHLSAGRLDVGIGAGGAREDFAALGLEFRILRERVRQLQEALDVFEKLADSNRSSTSAGVSPSSVQCPRPPVWIAGQGDAVLQVVARRADWANFARGIAPDQFARAAERVRSGAVLLGRPNAVRFSLAGTFLCAPAADLQGLLQTRAQKRGVVSSTYLDQLRAANAFVGSPVAIARQLAPYVDVGCEAFALWPLDGSLAAGAEMLAAVATAAAQLC